MTKHNFYIITGGPGGGKTSILNFLSSKGYDYVPETARGIIKHRLSQGLPPRPDPATFAQQMFIKDFENYISHADTISPLFFDRSFIDSAYLLYNADLKTYDQFKTTHLANRYNQKIFITPPWRKIYTNDAERDQSFKEAVELYEELFMWYKKHGYSVITLPKDTIEARGEFILSEMSHP